MQARRWSGATVYALKLPPTIAPSPTEGAISYCSRLVLQQCEPPHDSYEERVRGADAVPALATVRGFYSV